MWSCRKERIFICSELPRCRHGKPICNLVLCTCSAKKKCFMNMNRISLHNLILFFSIIYQVECFCHIDRHTMNLERKKHNTFTTLNLDVFVALTLSLNFGRNKCYDPTYKNGPVRPLFMIMTILSEACFRCFHGTCKPRCVLYTFRKIKSYLVCILLLFRCV